jgi:hypothetical protein
MKRFTKQDCGCYADGALGNQHIRDKLIELLTPICDEIDEIIICLNGQASDDFWEEEEAMIILNRHCNDGIMFEIVDGDLVLIEEKELKQKTIKEWRNEG